MSHWQRRSDDFSRRCRRSRSHSSIMASFGLFLLVLWIESPSYVCCMDKDENGTITEFDGRYLYGDFSEPILEFTEEINDFRLSNKRMVPKIVEFYSPFCG